MALSDLFSRRRSGETEETVGTSVPTHPTKALARFLTLLQSRPQPVLLDLGPVVGSNVTFFGEQLGCKIFVENIYKNLRPTLSDKEELIAMRITLGVFTAGALEKIGRAHV